MGDHSRHHCGCVAVWQTLNTLVRSKGWTVVKAGEGFDAIVVNGEGSMHHSSRTFHKKMKALREAVDAGKAAYLVNTVWQENSNEHDDVLRQLSGISVREVNSQKDLLERHGVKSRVTLDLAYFAPVTFSPSLRSLFRRKQAVRTDFWLASDQKFGHAVDPTIARLPVVSMTNITWQGFVAALRSADLLVTGRQHGVYAAARARVPFAALEGSTHKIRGLIATTGIDIPHAETVEELPDVVAFVRRERSRFDEFFRWMERQSPDGSIPFPGETWPT
jgi:polysaccharide pyruvyl transferase